MERHYIQRLFKQHYAKMLRVARTILYDEQESKDVVSDIFEGLLCGRTMLIPDTEERYLNSLWIIPELCSPTRSLSCLSITSFYSNTLQPFEMLTP